MDRTKHIDGLTYFLVYPKNSVWVWISSSVDYNTKLGSLKWKCTSFPVIQLFISLIRFGYNERHFVLFCVDLGWFTCSSTDNDDWVKNGRRT